MSNILYKAQNIGLLEILAFRFTNPTLVISCRVRKVSTDGSLVNISISHRDIFKRIWIDLRTCELC